MTHREIKHIKLQEREPTIYTLLPSITWMQVIHTTTIANKASNLLNNEYWNYV